MVYKMCSALLLTCCIAGVSEVTMQIILSYVWNVGVVVEALVADKNTPARFDALPSPDDPRAKPKILEIRTMFKSAICLSELIERTANKVSQ